MSYLHPDDDPDVQALMQQLENMRESMRARGRTSDSLPDEDQLEIFGEMVEMVKERYDNAAAAEYQELYDVLILR